MSDIYVEGLKELEAGLLEFEKKDMPLATAITLTTVAGMAQAIVLAKLPEQFTLRTGWYKPNTPFGFKVKAASINHPQAEIYTKAPWMLLHEEGGTKSADGKRLAVPFTYKQGVVPGVVYGVKRTKRDLIMKSQKPRNLGTKAFMLNSKGGDLLAMRTGRGKRSILRILYALEQQAVIKKRLGFADTARQVVKDHLKEIFSKAIEQAFYNAGVR